MLVKYGKDNYDVFFNNLSDSVSNVLIVVFKFPETEGPEGGITGRAGSHKRGVEAM